MAWSSTDWLVLWLCTGGDLPQFDADLPGQPPEIRQRGADRPQKTILITAKEEFSEFGFTGGVAGSTALPNAQA